MEVKKAQASNLKVAAQVSEKAKVDLGRIPGSNGGIRPDLVDPPHINPPKPIGGRNGGMTPIKDTVIKDIKIKK